MTATGQRMRRPRVVVIGIVSIAGVLAACGVPDDGLDGASAAPGIAHGPGGLASGATPTSCRI
jgi:hypothetical protein